VLRYWAIWPTMLSPRTVYKAPIKSSTPASKGRRRITPAPESP
jgi:hypothetical protein